MNGGFLVMFKRVFLFVLVNILVVITITASLSIFGVRPYLTKQGINLTALVIFCSVIGFGGAFISLMISRWVAKFIYRIYIIDPQSPQNSQEAFLIKTVYRFAQDCGIRTMPEVGIYNSPEVNAFATGATKNSSLVAVSSGLLDSMESIAIEGVLAHEVSHISNGDMVTMTLLQGIINTFVMVFARIAAWVLANALRSRDSDEISAPPYFLNAILVFIFEIFLSILGSIIVAFFSRIREFKADEGGASLAGTHKMIRALQSLQTTLKRLDTSHSSIATLKISGKPSSFAKLFSTHPDLEERIQHLRELEK